MKKLFLLLASFATACPAAIIPQASRVIFHPHQVRAPLLLVNSADTPALVQSWVDRGTPDKDPGSQAFPFVALPGVFTLNKGEKKEITIMRSALADKLPTDRESLYWLNIYEISSVKKSTLREANNKVSIALNTQLKVINRPFKETESFEQRTKRVIFKLQRLTGKEGVIAVNNTPYYFTPGEMSITLGQNTYPVYLDAEKNVAPFSTRTFPLQNKAGTLPDGESTLNYTAIDDQGALHAFSFLLRGS